MNQKQWNQANTRKGLTLVRNGITGESMMHCAHSETKMKLVIWAMNSHYGRRQYFQHKRCCTHCGAVIDST